MILQGSTTFRFVVWCDVNTTFNKKDNYRGINGAFNFPNFILQ